MNDDGALAVLLIEDNPADARIVREQFAEAERQGMFDRLMDAGGFTDAEVTHEDTLAAGRDRLADGTFDVVLLDLQLPDSDGVETVEAIVEVDPTIPVVVLTGMPEKRLGTAAVSRGAQDYLVKDDIVPRMLLLTVQYAIERKETEKKLRYRSEQLAILNRLTRHDIRNDVSLIVGRATELTENVDARGQDKLDEVIQSGNHILELTEMIGDALDAVADDSPTLSAVDLQTVLKEEVSKARELYSGATITLGAIPDVEVQGNQLLSSVFANLINNGVFYNDKETPVVHIEATVEGDTVRVTVTDNGPGIPKPQREAVFSDQVKGTESTGLGIGLTLAHRLITQFGGEIRIENNDPEGATFVIELQRI